MKDNLLWQIALTFASLSVVAVGGAHAVIPDIHRQVVNVLGWMNDATFANLFALSQAAPGPNVLIVSLIGWHVSGLAGMLVATLAMLLPSSLLALGAGRLVNRLADTSWIGVAKQGLVPIAIGLILGGGVVMARAADHDLLTAGITVGAAFFVFFAEKNPVWALAAGTCISMLGVWSGLPGLSGR